MIAAEDLDTIRVLLVDDEPDLLLLLRTMLGLDRRIQIAGEAASGEEALAHLEVGRADVVVLDQRLPRLTGLEVAAQVLERDPEQLVLLFTAYVDDSVLARAAEIGVRRVVSKDDIRTLADEIIRIAG